MTIGKRQGCLGHIMFCLVMSWLLDVVNGNEEILLDTRTATSDLGWTIPQDSEWQEMSITDISGNVRRTFTVCQVYEPNQDNWIRTKYIPVQGVGRIHVEVGFTIRSCDEIPVTAYTTCKETVDMYYYETYSDNATSTIPGWSADSYVKIDRLTPDSTFQGGSANTNIQTSSFGPITSNGIYLAFQDTGACFALTHVRVYYKYCEELIENLAIFARTISGPYLTSLVEARGSCIRNAIAGSVYPRKYCNSNGDWVAPSGECVCEAGYEPNHALTTCRET